VFNMQISLLILSFLLEEALLWIMDSYLSQKQWFKVQNVWMMDLLSYRCSSCLLQMLTDGLEWCGLLWCFYQTLILTAPIHCRASIAETPMQCYISPNLMKKQTHLGWSEGKCLANFNFGVKSLFNINQQWTILYNLS